jgi:hypothetical protein
VIIILVGPKVLFGQTESVIGLLAIIAVSIAIRNRTDRFLPGNDNTDSFHEQSSIFFRENSAPLVHTVWGDKKT